MSQNGYGYLFVGKGVRRWAVFFPRAAHAVEEHGRPNAMQRRYILALEGKPALFVPR